MLPNEVLMDQNRIDCLIRDIDRVVANSDLWQQKIYSSYIILAGSGYVENSINQILAEYGRKHSNRKISRFIMRTTRRNNSYNKEKIKQLLEHFDPSWWEKIIRRTADENIEAIDSLKSLRDQVAHGGTVVTGYYNAKTYYNKSKRFIADLGHIINQAQ